MLSIATNQFASFCIDIRSRQCYFRVCQSGEIWNKKAFFFTYILIFYYIKQIDSMLPCVCSVIDHRGRQNVVRTSVTHSAAPRVPLFCSYHILTSSVIYYWTDARQHGIYLLKWRFRCSSRLKLLYAMKARPEMSPYCHLIPAAGAIRLYSWVKWWPHLGAGVKSTWP